MVEFNLKIEHNDKNQEISKEEKEKLCRMENFYKKYFQPREGKPLKVSLEDLKELKEAGIATEDFLDFLCQKHGVLLHGSIHEISGNKLKSPRRRIIFATNKAAIAILRSLYSNIGVNLEYSYFINEQNPLVLKVHTPPNGKYIKANKGFVYVLNKIRFKNDPEGSWQFINRTNEVEFWAVVETEDADFRYPVEFYKDLNL